jgi:hypothetical protein
MDEELTKYLKDLKEKMKENKMQYISYIKEGNKLVKLGSSSTKKQANQEITKYMDEYEVDEGDKFITISIVFNTGKFLYGPLSMTCEIKPINDKGKISIKNTKVNIIRYLVPELKKRGYKKGDYKRLFNKLNNGKIESGLHKRYTAKDLD